MAVDEFLIVQVLHAQVGIDSIVGVDVQQILDGASLRVLRTFGYFVHLQPVALALLGEEHHGVVHRGRIDMFYEVLIAGFGTFGAYPTTVLCTEFAQRRTLDVAHVRDGDNHLVVGVEVFGVEFLGRIHDFGAALVAVFFFHLDEFVLNDLAAELVVHQDFLQVSNLFLDFLVFGVQLVLHQACELAQTHLNDGTALYLSQLETLHQPRDGISGRLGGTDDADYFVDIVRSDDQTFQNVGTLLSLAQVELRAADNDVVTMLYEVFDELFQVQQARTSVYQCHVVHAKRRLEHSHLVELVQHYAGVGIALHVDDDAHTFAVGFVVGVCDAFDFLLVGQVGDTLDELSLVYAIRYFGNDNLVMRLPSFNLGLGTHHYATTARQIGFAHTAHTIDVTSCGEVGSLDVVHQLLYFDIVVVNVGYTSVDHLREVMCRHIGGHTDGNT